MRVLSLRISDEDGSMVVEWYNESEQKQEGGTFYQTVITREALDRWERVKYYGAEVMEDLEELVHWHTQHSKGLVP